MQWQNIDLAKFVVAVAPFGGAIGTNLKKNFERLFEY